VDDFHHKHGRLHCEDVPLDRLAEAVGTPAYVYSVRTVVEHVKRLREAFAELDPLLCYALKANGNLALLDVVRRAGASTWCRAASSRACCRWGPSRPRSCSRASGRPSRRWSRP
jgi:diaminopimelate decarboxylase